MTGFSFDIKGLEDANKMLSQLVPREANNLMRATIHGAAIQAKNKIKQRAPVGYTGLLKKDIKAKRRRSKPGKPVSDVIIKSAFYWRFIEHGNSQGLPARPFVKPSFAEIKADMPNILKKQFGLKLEQRIKRLAKQQAKK